MSRRVLVDTGPLVALRNVKDQHRDRVLELSRTVPRPLYTCWPVLPEATYLLRAHPREIEILLGGFRSGDLALLSLTAADVAPVAAIMMKYEDQSLSLADASLMHLAEREGTREVFTVDPKDFSVFRTSDGQPLSLIV